MSLTNYRALGGSGLIISPLALGTMTFGDKTWDANIDAARSIFRAYTEAGGNFVDTADIYSGGISEEMTGQFMVEMKLRDQIVLATKFGFNGSSSPLSAERKKKEIQMPAAPVPKIFIARLKVRCGD